MIKKLFILFSIINMASASGQETNNFLTDKTSGCNIWAPGHAPDDSIRWTGGCKEGMAEGKGTLTFYSGKENMYYHGMMHKGKIEGQGELRFTTGIIRKWNFSDGELNGQGYIVYDQGRKKTEGNFVAGVLTLDTPYLHRLSKNVVSVSDTAEMYVNDGDSKQLFYTALIPEKTIRGALVLIPGTWEAVEHTIGSNKELCQLAYDHNIAVLVPSLNQRLVMDDLVLKQLNIFISAAIDKYRLPKEHFIMGGWSMGGLFSVRYGELSVSDPGKTVIVPQAIINVDGPMDLETVYHNSAKSLEKNPALVEPKYVIEEFKKYIGGTPESAKQKYIGYSGFSKSESDGGNAKYLAKMPIRTYNDVDVNWWMDNRGRDLYDMNASDQSAMINLLRQQGNSNAEFINAYGKGFRVEGYRHPHSWSIVDAQDCMAWILKWMK